MYNLMIGIGIIIGIIIFEHICSKKGVPKHQIDNLMLVICISIVFGFFSAALFDKLVHYHSFKAFLSHLFVFTGLTFAGGFWGGAIVFIISYKIVMRNFKNIKLHINCAAPSIAIAHSFGRIGCFLGGCCFGKPTHSIIGVQFPAGSLAEQFYEYKVKVIPTQLIEALFLLLLFFVLYFLLQKHAFSFYLLFYGVFRFIIEFFRGDNRGTMFQTIFTPSQCLSILMIFLGLWILYRSILLKHNTQKIILSSR
ncbi:MAG: prolipoprotein diacylglyceryl transferase [Bacillota bacterium]|nr:prolipoprotein diacylglyceryl transferase [Bacillota bacterium]